MKKFTLADGAALVIWLLPAVYLLIIYSSLPQIVPVHYGISGNVDRYGSKAEFLVGPGVLMGASALVYLLLKFLPSIDPKKQVKYGEATFQKIGLGLVVFLAALDFTIIFATAHHGFQLEKLMYPVIGLMFAFLGNVFNNVKPNYFAGFRTPWALESEDNWRATHRLAGKMWFAGGILITILALILPPSSATIAMLCIVVVMTIFPYAYSYRYFKRHHSNQNS
jgi:uncharacterized membrane protein